ncbi:MAG: Na+/H+ antiporter NhaA [Melioribacter sp.]|nr:Na+/H+ antiporter NhaA [Melioribacter sp.]
MKLTKLYIEFFNSEKAGGIILVLMTALSLTLANSSFGEEYIKFWNINIGNHSLAHWINDGLMAIFFLLIGLELEREIYIGELSDIKNATLPIFAAVGGMIIPATIYTTFNYGTSFQSGAGIPMATDIAFAIGILSLLGKLVPASLKIFLTALAVIDDLGAILVIAIFYTSNLSLTNLIIALSVFVILLILNRMNINYLLLYLIGGVIMWFFMSKSGVHATIAGVLLAFAIPFRRGDEKSPSYILQHFLHKPVAFIILPLFALANTCISVQSNWYSNLLENYSLGIILGLLLGKPIGITLFSMLGVFLGLCALPKELKWKNIIGVGFLAGIGFTMSIFITLLAFNDKLITDSAKISILIASLISGIIGYTFLKLTLKNNVLIEEENSR